MRADLSFDFVDKVNSEFEFKAVHRELMEATRTYMFLSRRSRVGPAQGIGSSTKNCKIGAVESLRQHF